MRNATVVSLAILGSLIVLTPVHGQALWQANGNNIFNTNTGFVGVGTNAPIVPLHVSGVGDFQDQNGNAHMLIGASQSGGYGFVLPIDLDTFAWMDIILAGSGGAVGIGTFNPDPAFRLSVNGAVRAKEIVVETGWADFVFAPDYRLPPLAEVESYIADNGHLPEIPSAQQVADEGVKLGAMQVKLLQKVEELTLYLIEQGKAIEQLRGENRRLKKTLDGEAE